MRNGNEQGPGDSPRADTEAGQSHKQFENTYFLELRNT